MRAILLGAGLGTRLLPLTERVPKCMIQVAGKPLLGWWFDLFRSYDFEEVLINTHYLPHVIENYVAQQPKDLRISLAYEPTLLGSGGTLRANAHFFDEGPTLVAYADNLTNLNLSTVVGAHMEHNLPFTLIAQMTENLMDKGVVERDDNGVMVGFEEKPCEPKSSIANAGIYIFSKEILQYIEDTEVCDIGCDILPRIIGRTKVHVTDDFLMDIGSPASLNLARREWRALSK